MAVRGPPPARRGDGHAFSLEEGTLAVKAARRFVEAAVRGASQAPSIKLPARFKEPSGLFTTLSKFPEGDLRGCVGFAEPVMPLAEALKAASVAAALEDGRFTPLTVEELPNIVVEVSLLTPPVRVDARSPEAVLRAVEVGRHGLIIRGGRQGGLLLPQVAVEWAWGAEEFLAHTCQKGGFAPDFWKEEAARVLTFEAEVFGEEQPRGEVRRREEPRPAGN
ncbi:MAG TPA: TIGR00296 family protein [Candidatus Thermoplasmatota archaeon]|nr:TIGR00296 family protein [Candidatus Thermoplasmatota archaeon]